MHKKFSCISGVMIHRKRTDEYYRIQFFYTTFNNSDAVALRSGSLQIVMKSNMKSQVNGNGTEKGIPKSI